MKAGLVADFRDLKCEIKKVQNGEIDRLEGFFEQAIRKQLRIEGNHRCTLKEAGTQNFTKGRKGGWINLVHEQCGFEFKVVRLPRWRSNLLYDVGQLGADFMRLRFATGLDAGWIVAFLYGPLVDDSKSGGRLLRSFSNAMFLDHVLSRQEDLWRFSTPEAQHACDMMGWNQPMRYGKNFDTHFGVLVGDECFKLGAVAISAKGISEVVG